MTGNQLVSRQAGNGIATAHPARPAERPFSEAMEVCNAIAGAGDLIPMCYRGKPGAVLLAKMWADRHLAGDVFTALQHIYPIQGRPYVSAEMRVELASAKGYDIAVVESNERWCKLAVTDPQGRANTVLAIMPGIDPTGPADVTVRPAADDVKKDNWKNRPGDMLYALACRVADRRLVRSGAALLDVAQDYADEPDVLDVLAPQVTDGPPANAAEAAALARAEAELADPDGDVADGELVEDGADPAERLAHLVASAAVVDLKDATVLKEANRIAREASAPPVATLADLAQPDRADLYDAVLDWIGGH